MPPANGRVWHPVQACCAVVAGFSGRDAWWQTPHLFCARSTCSLCPNFTPPIGAPVRTMTSLAFDAGFCASIACGANAQTVIVQPAQRMVQVMIFPSLPR